MDKQVNITEFINERVTRYGIGETVIQDTKTYQKLIQIEEYLQNIIFEQEQLKRKIKELCKLNVNSVSTGAKVPRSTIYNNPNTLYIYIEERLKEIEKDDILNQSKYEKLRNKNVELMVFLSGMQQHVVDNYELLLQIKEFETEVKSLNHRNESLLKKYQDLQHENDELSRKLAKHEKGKVLAFKGNQNQ